MADLPYSGLIKVCFRDTHAQQPIYSYTHSFSRSRYSTSARVNVGHI